MIHEPLMATQPPVAGPPLNLDLCNLMTDHKYA